LHDARAWDQLDIAAGNVAVPGGERAADLGRGGGLAAGSLSAALTLRPADTVVRRSSSVMLITSPARPGQESTTQSPSPSFALSTVLQAFCAVEV
jgi:hypothetical protein